MLIKNFALNGHNAGFIDSPYFLIKLSRKFYKLLNKVTQTFCRFLKPK